MKELDLESKFNKKYSIVTRRILRLLSNNSRISITEMAKELGLSRRTTATRLKKVEEAFHINYTLDLNEEKLGLESPNLILVKFLRRANLGKLRAASRRISQGLRPDQVPRFLAGSIRTS